MATSSKIVEWGCLAMVRGRPLLTREKSNIFSTNLRQPFSILGGPHRSGKRKKSFSRTMTSFTEGDAVTFTNEEDGSTVVGEIIERRRGWYTIQQHIAESNHKTLNIFKRRGKQLEKYESGGDVESSFGAASDVASKTEIQPILRPLPPPPTMLDLDELLLHYRGANGVSIDQTDHVRSSSTLPLLSQAEYIASHYSKWVTFTDLHCSPSTLNTTLETLSTIHTIASSRNAGVLFLGDFWHHRGSLPIPTLNSVLDALSTWTVPMIMIPGNHDQVTFRGEEHGLSALRNAYQLTASSPSSHGSKYYPGPLIFSNPTKFLNAAFIPHTRDNGVMESILSSSIATSKSTNAIFVHADVTGAYMNDLIQSQGGVPPSKFPPGKPIYSGHFHKPHLVKGRSGVRTGSDESNKVEIRYVGSPYETSLSEAGQEKALLVLDSSHGKWDCVETIPLNIGRKHYKCSSVNELIQIARRTGLKDANSSIDLSSLKRGDRVVITLTETDMDKLSLKQLSDNDNVVEIRHSEERNAMEKIVKELRDMAVMVEIRTTKKKIDDLKDDATHFSTAQVEDMTPENILASYLNEQVKLDSISDEKKNELQELGLKLIREITSSLETESDEPKSPDQNHEPKSYFSTTSTDMTLTSVTVQGFGSFKEKIEYPLDQRGLVLIRGKNMDGGSDSNGSGKSTLAMSVLWALTGSMDSRPVHDGKLSDVVNDSSKATKVTLRGSMNSNPFIITRTKTSKNKTSLTFLLGEDDLTKQSVKETQAQIDEYVGVAGAASSSSSLLARTTFHGQHSINGLLEATDSQWKEELALVVPLDVWKESSSAARKNAKAQKDNASKYEGMVVLREEDNNVMAQRCESARSAMKERKTELETKQQETKHETEQTPLLAENGENVFLDAAYFQNQLETASSALEKLEDERRRLLLLREDDVRALELELRDARASTSNVESEVEWCARELKRAKAAVRSAEEGVESVASRWNRSNDDDDEGSIEICPTCERPLSEGGHHDHVASETIASKREAENRDARRALENARRSVADREDDLRARSDELSRSETDADAVDRNLRSKKDHWDERTGTVDARIVEARELQLRSSAAVAEAVRAQSVRSRFENEVKRLSELHALSRDVHDSLESELESRRRQATELKNERDLAAHRAKLYQQLTDVLGARGVQTFVLQDAIDSLRASSQRYLDELSHGTQRLDLQLDSSDRISRLASIRTSDGTFVERPLSSLSGGQWRRCSLALTFGFAELVARRGGLRSSLLVLDEPLTHLDRTGREQVGALLRRMVRPEGGGGGLLGLRYSTILVILQDLAAEELGDENFDAADEVVKRDGQSRVVLDGGER